MSEEKVVFTEEERKIDYEYRIKLMEYLGRAAQGTAITLGKLDPSDSIFSKTFQETNDVTENMDESPKKHLEERTHENSYESPWLWALLTGVLGAGAPPADPLADKRNSEGLVGVVGSMLETAVNFAGIALEAKTRASASKSGDDE